MAAIRFLRVAVCGYGNAGAHDLVVVCCARSRTIAKGGGPIGQQQIADVFAPDPTRVPANQEEVLLMLAEGNHAESNNAKQ